MIKLAKVVSQSPSKAKKSQYITVLNDGFGEVRAYTTRKLTVGQEVAVSVQHGAANDPLSTTILTKSQEDNWRNSQTNTSGGSYDSPKLDFEEVQDITYIALSNYVLDYSPVSSTRVGARLKSRETTKKELAKSIYRVFKDYDYIVEGGTTPIVSIEGCSTRIGILLSISESEQGSSLLLTFYNVV